MGHTRVVGTTGTARRLTAALVTAVGVLAVAACGAPTRVAVVDSTAAVGAAPAPTAAGASTPSSRPVVTTEPPVPLTMNTVLPRPAATGCWRN